jgi:hypothetical protein
MTGTINYFSFSSALPFLSLAITVLFPLTLSLPFFPLRTQAVLLDKGRQTLAVWFVVGVKYSFSQSLAHFSEVLVNDPLASVPV